MNRINLILNIFLDIKYPLTNTRKILCVWAKRYPSLKDVPDHVTYAFHCLISVLIFTHINVGTNKEYLYNNVTCSYFTWV